MGSQTENLQESETEMIAKEPQESCGNEPLKIMLETTVSSRNLVQDFKTTEPENLTSPGSAVFFSPQPVSELDDAATKLQEVYKSFRTRRNLADSAVVVEELWRKALDFAALDRSSVSSSNVEKPEI